MTIVAETSGWIIRAYLLTLNEEANIARALRALRELGLVVTVLDSGSTDQTVTIASGTDGVTVRPYQYTDHCTAYNEITLQTPANEYVLVLDADMVVTPKLFAEVIVALREHRPAAVVCPIEMWWEGQPLGSGSLCPPKAVILRGGVAHFEAVGHGERLVTHHGAHHELRASIIHDDRKGFEAFLQSQVRYAKNLVDRAERGEITFKDRIYLFTPAVLVLQPLHSYFLRGGFRAGRAGLIYALDRVIAAAIVLRQGLARQLKKSKSIQP